MATSRTHARRDRTTKTCSQIRIVEKINVGHNNTTLRYEPKTHKRYRKQRTKTRLEHLCIRGSRPNAAVCSSSVGSDAPLHAPASLRTAPLFPPPFLQAPSACPTHQCPARASSQPLTRRPPFPTLFCKTPSTLCETKQGGGRRGGGRVQYGFKNSEADDDGRKGCNTVPMRDTLHFSTHVPGQSENWPFKGDVVRGGGGGGGKKCWISVVLSCTKQDERVCLWLSEYRVSRTTCRCVRTPRFIKACITGPTRFGCPPHL